MCPIFKRTFSNIFIPEVCLNVMELIHTQAYMHALFFLQKNHILKKNASYFDVTEETLGFIP